MNGALEENCGPHLTAVLLNQRIVRCIVYRRSTLAAHSFPPAASSPSHLLLATGKNSAAPERTFRSALVSAEWRAQRENDRREERGICAGHSKRIEGPTWKSRYIRYLRKEGE